MQWKPLGMRVRLWHVLAGLALALAGALAVGYRCVSAVWRDAPGLPQLRELQQAKPSVLVSADGVLLTTFVRTQQEAVPLARISPHVKRALLATEDQRFYEHRGIDVKRTIAAMWHTLRGDTQGGSTITQQLARNLFPDEIGRSRTLERKLKEMATATRIERAWSKDQILEHYLNSAPFLYNVVGIEMAARTYFDKPAADLDVLESATLVGMLKGTRYYNPVLNPERAQARRNVVLQQMVRQHALSEADYRRLRAQPLGVTLNRQPEPPGPAPHFAVQARRWLIAWADEHDYNLYADGLRIETTLDSRLQEAAQRAVDRQARALQAVADVEWSAKNMRLQSQSTEAYERQQAKVEPFAHFWSSQGELVRQFVRESPRFKEALKAQGSEAQALAHLTRDAAFMAQLRREKTRLEAGFVAIEPATGAVRAWVGSRDFDVDQYDHVGQATRQPGSTFKPFVYGAALEGGLDPNQAYVDGPLEVRLNDGSVWRPADMTPPTGEPMPMRDGLVYSKNTVTAQVALDVGAPRIVALARAMGVDQSRLEAVPSIALGTSPVTLLEMAASYATIAQRGQYHKPVTIRRIVDRQGRVLAEFDTETRRALSADAASDLIDMMRGVIIRGTGTLVKSRFGIVGDVVGKTGTSQNNGDGWFILMHPQLVAGAWVGFNDARVTLRSDYWGQGGHNAILLVGDFFRTAQKAKWISTRDRFPSPRHPAAPPASAPDAAAFAQRLEIDPTGAVVPASAPLPVITRREGDGPALRDRPAGSASGGRAAAAAAAANARRGNGPPPKSADEIERALTGIEARQRGAQTRVGASGE